MNLIANNYFGPQEYVSEIVTYPPYSERIKMIRYGYESKGCIYDVCIPEKPIGEKQVTRWYKVNGETMLVPNFIHLAIKKHFAL